MITQRKSFPQFWIVLLMSIAFIPFSVKAQIIVDLPVNNSVFQRDSSNQADIDIAGNYTSTIVSSIQARLVTPGTSSPISGFDWTIIDANPSKGQFYGSLLNVPAGWYTLQIRAVKSGAVIQSSSVSRVGVGDVFLAFGQSNAQGWEPISGIPVTSSKIITHNYFDPCSVETPNFPVLAKMESNSRIGQHGVNSWYWGKLGDNLVNIDGTDATNIPVAFFNAATSGASLLNFIESSNGNPTTHPFIFPSQQFCSGVNPDNPSGIGTPYSTFLKTIRYYNSIYGLRAVLFMQGESDNFLNTSQIDYKNRLDTLISKTRSDFGDTIPWVISRTSWYGSDSADINITNGQAQVISTGVQVFQGPYTDDLHNGTVSSSRDVENVHFQGGGLIEIGSRWFNYLTNNIYSSNTQSFYDLSNPISSNDIPEMTYSISGSNVTVTAPGGYSSYRWVTTNNYESTVVSTSSFLTASGSNVYRCFMTKANGQIVMSQKIDIGKITTQQTIPSTCPGVAYLSDYTPYSLQNGLGPVAFDQSNGGSGDGDGTSQMINSTAFSKGLGVYGNSEVVYRVTPGLYTNFKASIGIDDDVASGGSVIFKIYGDNTLLYTSSSFNASNNAVEINIPLCSYSLIKLVTEDAGDGSANDMANWADARFTCESIGATSVIYSPEFNFICIGDSVTPIVVNSGGIFSIISGSAEIDYLNSSTGTLRLNGAGPVILRYIFNFGTVCADTTEATVYGRIKPNSPIISSNTDLINIGDTLTLSSNTNCTPNSLLWSSGNTSTSFSIVPTDTTIFFANCKDFGCYSDTSNIIQVKVIPDCPESFQLQSTASDLNYSGESFDFFAEEQIEATNKLYAPTRAVFKAGERIQLQPGFEVEAGSVFSATIEGCP